MTHVARLDKPSFGTPAVARVRSKRMAVQMPRTRGEIGIRPAPANTSLPSGCDSDDLDRLIGDCVAIRAHAADYDSIAEFIDDETIACAICAARWYQPPPDTFEADILASDGAFVCSNCVGDFYAARPAAFGGDSREHGTLYARNGAVVG